MHACQVERYRGGVILILNGLTNGMDPDDLVCIIKNIINVV